MWKTTSFRRTTIRAAFVVSSMLLSSALIAGGVPAQTLPLPATEHHPADGIGVATGPDGVKLDVDAGKNGGVNLDAGPGGVNLGVRRPRSVPVLDEPSQPVSVPRRPATDTPGGGSAPGDSKLGRGPGGVVNEIAGDSGNSRGSSAADRRAGPAERGLATAAERARDGRTSNSDDGGRGVAPVFDLIEKIPAAVRAGLVALALIALAMWALWVRGRRRLEHNAYQDPVTGVANMAAFEQVLKREWQRASRYRRPLGLLLLDLGERGGRGLLGDREARKAVERISWEVRESDTVARLAPSRFAVISPEAPQGSIETLAHALEHRLEEERLRCWAGVAERSDADESPTDLVTRAAGALADARGQSVLADPDDADELETETAVFAGRSAAAA